MIDQPITTLHWGCHTGTTPSVKIIKLFFICKVGKGQFKFMFQYTSSSNFILISGKFTSDEGSVYQTHLLEKMGEKLKGYVPKIGKDVKSKLLQTTSMLLISHFPAHLESLEQQLKQK